jgi:chromosome segregation ATPase
MWIRRFVLFLFLSVSVSLSAQVSAGQSYKADIIDKLSSLQVTLGSAKSTVTQLHSLSDQQTLELQDWETRYQDLKNSEQAIIDSMNLSIIALHKDLSNSQADLDKQAKTLTKLSTDLNSLKRSSDLYRNALIVTGAVLSIVLVDDVGRRLSWWK